MSTKVNKVYLINIEKFNAKYDPDCSIERLKSATEEEIKAVVPDDEHYQEDKLFDGRYDMSGCYTLEEFINIFNYALEKSEISTADYYIRTF